MINFEDFKKVDLRVGKIEEADKVENSDKLIKMIVNTGEEKRQILGGIAEFYKPEDLIGKEVVVVVNLEPRSLMGFESNGMVLAIGTEKGPVLISPEEEVDPGSKVT